MNQKNNISHSDIAKLANVTRSTVSRALDPKHCHLVSAKTREKIEKIATEHGFVQNIHARRVKNLCSEAITLVIDNLVTDRKYFSDFNHYTQRITFDTIDGIVNGAIDEGFEVKLIPLNTRKPVDEEFLVKHLEFPYSDGVIFIGYFKMRQYYDILKNCQSPMLIVSGSDIPDVDIPVFFPNPLPGINEAAKCLIEQGHRNFAYHAFDLSTPPFYQKERLKAWQNALESINSTINFEVIEAPDMKSIGNMARSFSSECPFSVILAANDGAAHVWRHELGLCGVRIPEDIAIVGYDGNTSYQGLSSVAVPYYDMAYAASNRLVKIVKEKQAVEIQGEQFSTFFRTGSTT